MTAIGELAALLAASGLPAEKIALAIDLAQRHADESAPRPQMSATPIDAAAERRRALDRERKRLTRDQRLPEAQWLELVRGILARDACCQYCGEKGGLTADHVHPVSRGGTHDPSNLVACCIPCNSKKGNRLLAEWLPDPQTSADKPYISEAAKAIIVRETSAEIRRHPQMSETALTLTSSSKDSLEKEKKVRGRKSACPPDYEPKPSHFAAADKLGLPHSFVHEKTEDMRLWAQSSGAVKKDWDATLHVFIRKDAGKLKESENGNPQSASAAARRLLANGGFSFGPRPGSLRVVEGGDDARLLSQGRSDQSGDVRSGSGGGSG